MPAPVNDNFANRILLSDSTSPVSGDNTGATLEAGETYYADEFYDSDNSVWYEFVPSRDGVLHIDTEGSTGLTDSVIWIFTGTAVNALTLVNFDDDGGTGFLSSININVTSGISYKIAVTGYDPSEFGAFKITAYMVPIPANDNFSNAIVLSGSSVSTSGSNLGATREASEPSLGYSNFNSVWYEWTAPTSGTVFINTYGSNYQTALAVFTGTTLAGLTLVQKDNHAIATRVYFSAIAGATYKILVDGGNSQMGNFNLNILYHDFPVNDDFADAELIEGMSATKTQDTTYATTESGEPTNITGLRQSVWYKWRPPASGLVLLTTTGSSFTCQFKTYVGNAVNALTLISPHTSSPYRFWANVNTDYYFQVGGANAVYGTAVFNLTLTASPVNVNRFKIDINGGTSRPNNRSFVVDSKGNYWLAANALYKSSNQGKDWTNVASIVTLSSPGGNDLAVNMVVDNQDNLYAFWHTEDGSFRIIYYYSKFNTSSMTWSTPVEMSLSTTTGFAQNSTIVIDSSNNIYFIYVRSHESADAVYDLYYRKLYPDGTLDAEVNITNYTLTGLSTNKQAESITAVACGTDIYLAYRFFHRVSNPSFSVTKSLIIIKNFVDITTLYTFTESSNFSLINAGQFFWPAISDEDGVGHFVYKKSFLDGATLKSQLFYVTTQDLSSSIHLSSILDTEIGSPTFITSAGLILQKNHDGEMYLFFGHANGSTAEIKYMKKDSATSVWSELAILYSLPSSLATARMAHWDPFPIVGGVRHSYRQSTFSFIEEGSLYYVEASFPTENPEDITGEFTRCAIAREAVNVFNNLSHLEGQVVGVIGNGNFLGFQKVVNGAIQLTQSYSHIIVGLPYLSDLETLPIEVPLRDGSIQGKRVKVANVTFRFIKSVGGFLGPNKNRLYEAFKEDVLAISNQAHKLDAPIGDSSAPKLYTVDVKQPLGGEYKNNGRVFYRQKKPQPVTIGAIVPEINIPSYNAK